MHPTAATELAESVLADGFGSHRAALAALFAGARRRGVTPVLVAVAADPTEPTVARLRALGRVVVEYSRLVEAEQAVPADPPPPFEHRAPVARALAASASAA